MRKNLINQMSDYTLRLVQIDLLKSLAQCEKSEKSFFQRKIAEIDMQLHHNKAKNNQK